MEHFLNKIHCGDCLKVLEKIPPESVDITVTSPPYNIKNSSGNGLKNGNGGKWPHAELINGYDNHDDCMPRADYILWQRQCITAILRVLKPDGALFYNHKPRVQRGLLEDPHHKTFLAMKISHYDKLLFGGAKGGLTSTPAIFYRPMNVFILGRSDLMYYIGIK